MRTIYLNFKTGGQVETVDEFTQGQNAPSGYFDFLKYVRKMANEYRMAGMAVYQSQRADKTWAQK